MKSLLKPVCLMLLVVLVTSSVSPLAAEDKVKTLIVTGFDVASHQWQESTRLVEGILKEGGRFDVTVSADKEVFASPSLRDYDVVVLTYGHWNEPDPSEQAKAGLLNLTQTLAVEWAPKVRVNAVAGGMIRTEQAHLHYGDEAGIAAVAKTVPLGRLGEPRDVGDACLFLASPLASYVSGATLVVHGGGERPAFLAAATKTNG